MTVQKTVRQGSAVPLPDQTTYKCVSMIELKVDLSFHLHGLGAVMDTQLAFAVQRSLNVGGVFSASRAALRDMERTLCASAHAVAPTDGLRRRQRAPPARVGRERATRKPVAHIERRPLRPRHHGVVSFVMAGHLKFSLATYQGKSIVWDRNTQRRVQAFCAWDVPRFHMAHKDAHDIRALVFFGRA